MDPVLQQKIQEAREAGYSEQEIQEYLQTQGRPVRITPEPSRSEEMVGTAQMAGLKIGETAVDLAKYGLGGYGAYKAAQAIMNRGRPPVPPTPPASLPVAGSAQNVMDILKSPTGSAPAQQPNWMQRALQSGQQAASSIGQRVAPAAQAMAPYAEMAARYGAPLALLTASKGLGPKVPSKGPYRGYEINPATGQGWTPEEITAYEATVR
jgi:hypothetical protein